MECPHANGCQCKDDRADTTRNDAPSSVRCITSTTERIANTSDDLVWRTGRIHPERVIGLLECLELTLQECGPSIVALAMGETFPKHGFVSVQIHEVHLLL